MSYPYTADHGVGSLRFIVTTAQADEWYVPIKDYAKLEYEWVLENVPLRNARVIDGGAHHGHYSLVFAHGGAHVTAVDPNEENFVALGANMALNGFDNYYSLRVAVWKENGKVWFTGESNGMVGGFTGVQVPGMKLNVIDPLADVVKLDIEGAEHVVIPACLEDMHAHTWIVECHLSDWRQHNWPECNPDMIARLFKRAGFRLDWVNREKMIVEPYDIGTAWATHSTLIARR
jgi:FkbM family methyltransferase